MILFPIEVLCFVGVFKLSRTPLEVGDGGEGARRFVDLSRAALATSSAIDRREDGSVVRFAERSLTPANYKIIPN